MKKTLRIYAFLLPLFLLLATNWIIAASSFSVPSESKSKDREIPPNGYQIKTIVLDAGHGGRDAGCSGKHSKEKYIALNIVLKLGRAIEQRYPNVDVIYTRKTDVFIPLYKRAAIANKNNADLFISIHCNALSHKAHLVHGSETYVMGLHTAEHNLDVARRENESILLEADYEKNYQGFDPNSDEGHIFLSMVQNAFLDKSIQFAEKVESKIKIKAQRRSRGVKQAGFVVLKETTMPSVLIETGYLTNANEEAFLKTDQGQSKIANAIFEAFSDYKLEVEEQTFEPVATPATLAPPAVALVSYTEERDAASSSKQGPKAVKSAPIRTAPAAAKVVNPSVLWATEKDLAPKKIAKPAVEKSTIVFKIQLAASPAEIETSNQKWSKIPFVEVRRERNLYKYLTGSHPNYQSAVKDRNDALDKGFNGAFIVAYKNGQRIPLKNA
ncbi:MAG: N-acetylmuramoyl-L-alanine amidase, partial [Bacteroidota bacterium]